MDAEDFREDLFYRLNVMPIFLPPLRDRPDNIPVLAETFLQKFSKLHDKKINSIEADCLDTMRKYRWPGNIRELENIIERAFIVEASFIMTKKSLPEHIVLEVSKAAAVPHGPIQSTVTSASNPNEPLDFEIYKEKVEKDFID